MLASAIYAERGSDTPQDNIARLLGLGCSTYEPQHQACFFKAARLIDHNNEISAEDKALAIERLKDKLRYLEIHQGLRFEQLSI
jgi:hypothetical protein